MVQRKIKRSKGKENKGGARLGRLVMGDLSMRVKFEHGLSCDAGASHLNTWRQSMPGQCVKRLWEGNTQFVWGKARRPRIKKVKKHFYYHVVGKVKT